MREIIGSLSFSLSLFLLFLQILSPLELYISIDRDREIFLFRISRDDGPLHDIADDRKESLNARSTFYNRLRLHQ